MPIDVIEPFLDLMEKTGKPAGANGDARVPLARGAALVAQGGITHVTGSDRQSSHASLRRSQ
jgi:hypothetical protein